MSISAEDIIFKYTQGRMFPSPDYYDGRGNSLHDLNSPILELLYTGIQTEISPDAAKSFVNMVKNLRDTNAKSFLEALYKLERKGWRYIEPVLKIQVAPIKPDAAKTVSELKEPPVAAIPVKRVTEVLNAFKRSGSNFGHDKAITEDFLKNHRSELNASGFSNLYKDVTS